MTTLPAFEPEQYQYAKELLATQITLMMGRKYEEGDWSEVYETVKEIPRTNWSNLSIDVMHGNLGVEHKMLCRPQDRPILSDCGTDLMHPAGTRSIRIPAEDEPTTAARIILDQYGELIRARTAVVDLTHEYHHGRMGRGDALETLISRMNYGRASAEALLPKEREPVGSADASSDMRFGWLLWKNSLDEFLYFEEPMIVPDPSNFQAEWRESGGGRRRSSRNLWVYEISTGRKVYSITTAAGAKIQPYFHVPPPDDPNLYHFVVRGEKIDSGNRLLWLQNKTATELEKVAGGLDISTLSRFLAKIDYSRFDALEEKGLLGSHKAVAIEVSEYAYFKLRENIEAVSDEHAVQKIVSLY